MHILHDKKPTKFQLLARKFKILFFITLTLIFVAIVFISPFFVQLFKAWLLEDAKKMLWFITSLVLIVLFIIPNSIRGLIDSVRGYKYGNEATGLIVDSLKEILDDTYTYVTNYSIPIDGVKIPPVNGLLIGPKGVIIIEARSMPGRFRVSGKQIYKKILGLFYTIYDKDPFAKLYEQKEYLDDLLRNGGIETKAVPVIAVAGGTFESIKNEGDWFIMRYDKLNNFVFQMTPIYGFSESWPKKVLNALGIHPISSIAGRFNQ